MSFATESPLARVGAGVAGALALNILHEGARHILADAPRVDLVGERAVERAAMQLGASRPGAVARYAGALSADIIANSVYFASFLRGEVRHPVARGLMAGLAAGLSTTWLAPAVGLAKPARRARTRAMTVAWYLGGGLAAGGVYMLLTRKSR